MNRRPSTRASIGPGDAGFTLVEILLVLLLLGLLASFAAPVVNNSVVRAEEAALKENLHVMRKAIDDYYADHGSYPPALAVLVAERYLRVLPKDPVADDDGGWAVQLTGNGKGVQDVRSRSDKLASDGSRYDSW